MSGNINSSLKIKKIETDFGVSDVSNLAWKAAEPICVDSYWSGMKAPTGRQFRADLLWSDTALYARFEADQAGEIVMSDRPQLEEKSMNLWDRDVCEIFVAPDRAQPRKYFEFEAAPTGEWLDVALDSTSGERVSDWGYASGMKTAAKVEDGRVVIALTIPWEAFGRRPEAGDVWLGNILRCVGKDPGRGYLAWQPTMTEQPNFHVPERFGEFRFVR